MKYPILSELNTSREWLDVFKGYNHNLRIGDGEFYEMTNLSSDNFPILSPRGKRGIYLPSSEDSDPQAMVAKDALCYVDGSDFVINEHRVPMGFREYTDDDGKVIQKTLISMGAYVIIMPDRKYINTANLNDKGDIDAEFVSDGSTGFALCRENGMEYQNVVGGSLPPAITEEMEKDPSKIPYWASSVLKQYSVSDASWITIPNTYIKISSPGIGLDFSVGDGVTIEGVVIPYDINGLAVIQAKDESKDESGNPKSDWIVVKGFSDVSNTQANPVRITRTMPNLDFVIESGNRLWGCRYGIQGNKIVNEIYASKLGDFKNWNCFAGISTDSYAASVGTDGQFTGAITHFGYPLFFKENCIHKVYGNYPANYQVQTTACRGVQKGCERSLAIVNEVLYYKARSGICAYDGSLPEEISASLGEVAYHGAVAGSLGNKYYVSMADASENWNLFVFDTMKGMWHREDGTRAIDFCNYRGDLYYIDSDRSIKTVKGTGTVDDAPIKWQAVTGIIGTDSPDKKYISRMEVRMSLSAGARVSFYAEYDSSGEWEHLFTMDGVKLRTFAVPIRPQRCDHLRLRIVGFGEAKIFSICKTVEWGSDA